MSALNRSAAYSIAQTQILVITHPRRVLTIVPNEGAQALSCFRRAGSHAFQSTDHALNFTRAQIFCNCVHPPFGLSRGVWVGQPSKLPSVLHCVPEVENFTSSREHRCAFPDPLGAITDDDHNGMGAQPT